VAVTARRIEFLEYDRRTGSLRLRVSAREAVVERGRGSPPRAGELKEVVLVHFDGKGGPVLTARAESGRYARGEGTRLSGGVDAEWHGAVGRVRLRCPWIDWDETSASFRTEELVRGELVGQGDEVARGSPSGTMLRQPARHRRFGRRRGEENGVAIDFEGRGLVLVPDEDSARIGRDAAVLVRGGATGPWRVTADGGLELRGLGAGSLSVRFTGPVAAAGRGFSGRADEAGLGLREGPEGLLGLSGGWARGTVLARLTADAQAGARAGSLPTADEGRLPAASWLAAAQAGDGIEARAAVAEGRGDREEVVLHGTVLDPARVIFAGGELRGSRIELSAGRAATDGGARSEFRWESRRKDGR
jgi:hypothetical protein